MVCVDDELDEADEDVAEHREDGYLPKHFFVLQQVVVVADAYQSQEVYDYEGLVHECVERLQFRQEGASTQYKHLENQGYNKFKQDLQARIVSEIDQDYNCDDPPHDDQELPVPAC